MIEDNIIFLALFISAIPYPFLTYLVLLNDGKTGVSHIKSLIEPETLVLGLFVASGVIGLLNKEWYILSIFSFVSLSIAWLFMFPQTLWNLVKTRPLPTHQKFANDLLISLGIFLVFLAVLYGLYYSFLPDGCYENPTSYYVGNPYDGAI